jgi:aminoglycoside phosphotransferase (APT) family kinase protein
MCNRIRTDSPDHSADVTALLTNSAAFRDRLGASIATLRVERLDRGDQTSERYRIRWRDGHDRAAFAKRYLASSPADVAREYDALERVGSALAGHDGIVAPRPMFVVPAASLIVVEWIDGEPLSKVLFRSLLRVAPGGSGKAVKLVERAADALSALRAISVERAADVPGAVGAILVDRSATDEVATRYRRDLERRLAGLGGAGLDDLAERIRAAVSPAIDGIAPENLVFQHSDFGPWNLIADSAGRLCVFDLPNATVGHRAYDVAYFLAALDLLRRYRALSPRRIDRASDAFRSRIAAQRTESEPDDDAIARFALMQATYFAAMSTLRESRRDRIWLPRPLTAFAREWLERSLTTSVQPSHSARSAKI